MKTCTILVGPAGSGKSTYAKDLETHGVFRVSQDDQGKDGHFGLFKAALEQGLNVVVDRMGFSVQQRSKYIVEARKLEYSVNCVVFYTPKDICYERCVEREGHPTIKDGETASRALSTFFSKFEFPSLEEGFDSIVEEVYTPSYKSLAIISDLDGTLCDIDHRLHYVRSEGKKNWTAFFENMTNDKVNLWCADLLQRYKKDTTVILCSGRSDNYKKLTEEWLYENDIEYDKLFMRPRNDFREDSLIKKIIYFFELRPKYDILFVIDDRSSVVEKCWREQGLVTLQCAEGNF